jgi:hypothetical protein
VQEIPMRALILALTLAAGPAVADDEFLFFQSPTGNIGCMLMTGSWDGARCDIFELTMSFPTPPADCDLDWGHAFEVAAHGGAGPVCAGDTVFDPGGFVLGYGKSVTLGGVTCTSEKTGMTCTNARGHGFSVARARQKVF